MCSAYWNLTAKFTCPHCGKETEDTLQTHWMGEPGSCLNYYVMGQPVEELKGIEKATIGKDGPDDFIGGCDHCDVSWIDLGARIENGAVVEVWPYRWHIDGQAAPVTA